MLKQRLNYQQYSVNTTKSEYNHSVIKKAVMHMLNHFKKVTIGEKEAIKYQINGYYKSGQDKLPNSLI